MPYILQEHRFTVDIKIDNLIEELRRHAPEDAPGILNYIFTRLLLAMIYKPSYNAYNTAVGILETCKLELYRRHIALYEDKKCRENGDVA